MSSYRVTCTCGVHLNVALRQAGTTISCSCGCEVNVPTLSELCALRQQQVPRDLANEQLPKSLKSVALVLPNWSIAVVAIVCFAMLPLAYWIGSAGTAMAISLGVCLILVSKIWFVAMLFHEMGANALFVILVPYLDFVFAVKRFDVAWQPVAFQLGGITLVIAGIALANS